MIGGVIAFIAGFFGPMIFLSDSNTGPLLGFFTAPVGFIAGLLGGGVYYQVTKKKKAGNIGESF